MYLIPSIVCAFLLAGMGETISVMDMSHEEIHNQTNTAVTIHEHYSIALVNPIWITVNFMFGIIMTFHFIMQTLQLLLFRD
jgi:hypothetical protein